MPATIARGPALRGLLLPALAAFCVGGLVLGGCLGGYDRHLPGSARSWIEGPARWLVLPEEARRFRRLDSGAEALAFIEEFWRRRDPDPQTPGNPFAQQFFERVQAADLLYDGQGVRGAMTDRGRALLLFGSPSILRYTQRTAPAWEGRRARGRVSAGTERVRVEVWGYVAEDLPSSLLAAVEEAEIELPIELTFFEEERRTRLVEGEELLELAARAAVRPD